MLNKLSYDLPGFVPLFMGGCKPPIKTKPVQLSWENACKLIRSS